jgi:antitoxin HicB
MKYSIDIVWSDEDSGYIATIPEFKNLSAFGETCEDALREAKIALEGYIEAYKEDGLPLPEPTKVQSYSGQLRLRMPRELHQRLSLEAMRQDVSLNTFMVYLLSGNYSTYKEMHAKQQLRLIHDMRRLFKNDITTVSPEVAGNFSIGYREDESRDSWELVNMPNLREEMV